jgi:lysine 2,3-aminomutase
MKLHFHPVPIPDGVSPAEWQNWQWQLRQSLKTKDDFARRFVLSENEEAGFTGGTKFQVRATPYYASLAATDEPRDPIRQILMPTKNELSFGAQALLDPLGERRNSPAPRIIHRYPDRVLFLVTDTCSVYCRYCTRKHFAGGDEAFVRSRDYELALTYIRSHPGVREVILSGGDPLTLSDGQLERVLSDLRRIDSVEIIRIGSRMPVVCPMRVTPELVVMLRKFHPVFLMTHFNHPREVTREAADAITLLVDHGVPVFNQLVLLNGINNDAAIVQAVSRRLLYLRAKPYYMFQCDPSEGTDHLRTSVDESLAIQRELWGRLSGLAMPNLSLDIPGGGGKVGLVPNFEVSRGDGWRSFEGWDGVRADYVNPDPAGRSHPIDADLYRAEWAELTRC